MRVKAFDFVMRYAFVDCSRLNSQLSSIPTVQYINHIVLHITHGIYMVKTNAVHTMYIVYRPWLSLTVTLMQRTRLPLEFNFQRYCWSLKCSTYNVHRLFYVWAINVRIEKTNCSINSHQNRYVIRFLCVSLKIKKMCRLNFGLYNNRHRWLDGFTIVRTNAFHRILHSFLAVDCSQ